MNAVSGLGITLLAGIAAVAWTAPATAQVRSGGTRPQGSGHHGPGGRPPSRTIELPPESLGPGSLGLLEREFQYMRRTAPQPDKFLYGRWNPRYQTITPAVPQSSGPGRGGGYYGGPYYGGPYYGGPYYGGPYAGGGIYGGGVYGGGVYGGGVFTPYGSVGYGYSQYGVPPAVVQQEVVVVQDRAQELQKSGGLRNDPRTPAVRQPEQPATKPSLDDFYLGGKDKAETISDALDDIRKAWLNGDFTRLEGRFLKAGKVKVFPKGEYKYTVETRDFTAMLKDAMTKIDTVSFELDRPKSEESGLVLVTGSHTFVDADKEKRTTYVSYGLQKVEGRWQIIEAGSSSAPILKHSQP